MPLNFQEKDLSRITEDFGVMAEQETECRLSAQDEEYNQWPFSLHCLFLEEHSQLSKPALGMPKGQYLSTPGNVSLHLIFLLTTMILFLFLLINGQYMKKSQFSRFLNLEHMALITLKVSAQIWNKDLQQSMNLLQKFIFFIFLM